MQSDRQSHDKTIALLDVDRTLLGNVVIDYNPQADFKSQIAHISEQLRDKKNSAINRELLQALQVSNIKDIYLFTDMRLSAQQIMERQGLVEALNAEGFTVHGVIVPADPVWHLSQSDLEDFIKSDDSKRSSEIQSLTQEGKKENVQKHIAEIRKNITVIKCLQSASEDIRVGEAFASGLKSLDSEVKKSKDEKSPQIEEIMTKSAAGKSLADALSVIEDLPHVKGKMFQYFLTSNKKLGFTKCIVADDLPEVLTSVHQANERSENPIQVSTIYVAKYQNKKPINDTQKNYLDILFLQNACFVYEAYLKTIIENIRAKNNNDEVKCDKNYDFSLAKKKLAAIKEIRAAAPVDRTKGTSQIDAFKLAFDKHRQLMVTRRDSCGITFLKIAATILTAGYAIRLGIWKVKGRETVDAIESLLPPLLGRSA